MTKKELEQYRSIVAEIDEVRERLKDNTISDTVVGSSPTFPYTAHTISIGGDDNIEGARRERAHLARLSKQKNEIEDFITSIPDSLTRRIFKLRYTAKNPNGEVKPPSWQWIAFKINHHDEQYPRRIHNNFLKMTKMTKNKC